MTRLEIIELINKHVGSVDTHTRNNIIDLIEKIQNDNCSQLHELIKFERELTYMFDSDVRVALALLEVIRTTKL